MNLGSDPQNPELHAPPAWRTVDFISDLHLQAGEPATFEAWAHYLAQTPAGAVFILGDLFDVWVGDDSAEPGPATSPQALNFEQQCAQVLQQAAAKRALFFMHGNRDFLVGPQFMAQCNCSLLDDPTLLVFAGQRWLLSHGDALCLADIDYMKFRAQVRSAQWQQDFLAQPLAKRQAIARDLRQQSQNQHEQRKLAGTAFIDVDDAAARQWLQAAHAQTLIHGHTHRPARHDLGDGLQRLVLSDWDAAASPARAEVLRLTSAGLRRIALA